MLAVSDLVLSIVFATVAAFFFGAASIGARAGIEEIDPFTGTVISLTVNVIVLWAYVLAFLEPAFDLWAWRYFIAAGVMAPVLGRLLNYEGIRRVGVNLASPIVFANPLVAVALAIVLLGERIAPIGYPGVLLVIAGGIVLGTTRGAGKITFKRTDLLFPVLAAVMYGGSHIFRKVGVDLVAAPLVGATVNFTTSWAIAVLYLLASARPVELGEGYRPTSYFVLAGLATSIALPALFMALEIGLVIVVAPFENLTPLFVLLLSYAFFREEELFSWRVLTGTVSVVIGVILLTVATT